MKVSIVNQNIPHLGVPKPPDYEREVRSWQERVEEYGLDSVRVNDGIIATREDFYVFLTPFGGYIGTQFNASPDMVPEICDTALKNVGESFSFTSQAIDVGREMERRGKDNPSPEARSFYHSGTVIGNMTPFLNYVKRAYEIKMGMSLYATDEIPLESLNAPRLDLITDSIQRTNMGEKMQYTLDAYTRLQEAESLNPNKALQVFDIVIQPNSVCQISSIDGETFNITVSDGYREFSSTIDKETYEMLITSTDIEKDILKLNENGKLEIESSNTGLASYTQTVLNITQEDLQIYAMTQDVIDKDGSVKQAITKAAIDNNGDTTKIIDER